MIVIEPIYHCHSGKTKVLHTESTQYVQCVVMCIIISIVDFPELKAKHFYLFGSFYNVTVHSVITAIY